MKKTLKLLAAVALMALTAAACQKESLVDKTSEGNESVTFTVQTDAAATKATTDNDGQGAGLTRCLVAVYMKTGNSAEPYKLYQTLNATQDDANEKRFTFTVNLIRKQTYQIVVWADKGKYTVPEDLSSVTRIADDKACNSDAYDAFYASTEFVQGRTTTTTIEAKRPFAQLNLITKDLNENFQPGAVSVTYSSPQSFYPFDGTVSAATTEVTYKADSPYYTSTAGDQHTLVMNYLFAAAGDQTILPSVKMTAKLTVDAEIEVANVPVKRNYRTNIIGNLLTEQTNFNITVEPAWGGSDIDVQVADDITSANAAFEAGKTVVEVASITSSDPDEIILPNTDLPVSLTLPAAPDGKSITIKYPDAASNVPSTVNIKAVSAASLTIQAPQSHVELNGINVTNLTASTSNNTLVVGSDVTVKTLTIEAGSAIIYGTVKTKLEKGENAGEIEWHVTTSGSLTKALKVADKIVLEKAIKPFVINSSFTIDRDVTIDLNGFSLTATNYPLYITKGNVNIIGRGELIGAYSMLLKGSKDDVPDYCVVNLGPDVVLKASSCGIIINPPASTGYNNYGIVVNSKAQIISDAESSIGITINGSNKITGENVPKFNITGGKIDATVGIYAAGYAEWNLSNCEVEGNLTAIEIRAGKMTIDGGAYTSNKDPFDVEPNGSGTTTEGAALGISQHATDLPIEVVVNGGTFKGAYAIWEKDVQNDVARDQIRLAVNGGEFNGEIYSQNNAAFITGGTFSTDPSAYLPYEYDAVLDGNVYRLVKTVEQEGNTYTILSKKGLIWFEKEVNINSKSFSRKTVLLGVDIDLDNAAWTPVGQTGATQFMGTFDGQNHTISNLKINNTDEGGNCATGLFGWLNSAIVKNIKISGANITGHHNVGTIAGYLETSGCTIEGCTVENATISCTSVNSEANGDKCGGIVGHAGNGGVKVKNCVVSNSSISAGRDAGQVVGAAKAANIDNCSASNVTVTANGSSTGANIREEVIGRVL